MPETTANSPYRPRHNRRLSVRESETASANGSSVLYVEVEDGERVVLPPGMTEVDLLRSMLRQVLAAVSS